MRRRPPLYEVVLVAAAVVASVVGQGTLAFASTPSPFSVAGPNSMLPPPVPIEKHAKLGSQLLAVASAAETAGAADGLRVARERRLPIVGANVRVIVTAVGTRSAVRNGIQAVGGWVEAEYADLVQAIVPATGLRPLAELPAVGYVAQPSVPAIDTVTDEGVAATNASAWQAAGFAGSGVKVGIIDLGFIGYASAQASGDLPATLTTADFGCGGVATVTDHGTAVAEIVHNMAPGAQLYLICIATSVNLGQAKDYAIAQGIRIVNHSVAWFNSSRGDGSGAPGSPDAIAGSARANGILWVNAAGNEAERHWSGTFADGNGNGYHDFAPNNDLNTFVIAGGATACAELKWDRWPVTNQDFDLYLYRTSSVVLVASSADPQTGSQPPVEQLCFLNSGATQTFGLAISRVSGTSAPRFDLFISTDGTGPLTYRVAAGSIVEPASSPSTMAVGAICWQNDALEPYSSQGPTIDGRAKPDIAGQDATSSPVYGPASGCGGGFTGTSAGAPHVTGAAALVSGANPSFTPSQIQSFLEGHAGDLGPGGKDNLYGSGKLRLTTPPPTDFVFDVTGYFVPDASGATYLPLTPARLLDSRFGNGLSGKFTANTPRTFQVTGRGGVPLNAVGVTGNFTVTNQTAAGAAFLGPDPNPNPSTSTLNFPLGDNRANGVTLALGSSGTLSATYLTSTAWFST